MLSESLCKPCIHAGIGLKHHDRLIKGLKEKEPTQHRCHSENNQPFFVDSKSQILNHRSALSDVLFS